MSSDLDKQFLDPGDSIFELIEFAIERDVSGKKFLGKYGVNVGKVREVLRMPEMNPLATTTKAVVGIFQLRGVPIPAVHLAKFLGDQNAQMNPAQKIIVTEFSQKRAGFIVDSTHRIRRLQWEQVLPPSGDAGSCISGMALIENNEFLFILDLERILMEIEHEAEGKKVNLFGNQQQPAQQQNYSNNSPAKASRGVHVLLIDDSDLILKNARNVLTKEGYQVVTATNGKEGYDLLDKHNCQNQGTPFDVVVTDIEMPRMDGLTLTKKIRDHATLGNLPVFFHSSLSGQTNQAAGISVGGNGYVIKNDFKTLLQFLDEVEGKKSSSMSA